MCRLIQVIPCNSEVSSYRPHICCRATQNETMKIRSIKTIYLCVTYRKSHIPKTEAE